MWNCKENCRGFRNIQNEVWSSDFWSKQIFSKKCNALNLNLIFSSPVNCYLIWGYVNGLAIPENSGNSRQFSTVESVTSFPNYIPIKYQFNNFRLLYFLYFNKNNFLLYIYIFDFFHIFQKFNFFILYTFLSMRANFQGNLIFFLEKVVCCNICLNKILSIWYRPLKLLPLIFCYTINILAMESTLAKKITTIFFLYFGIFLFTFSFYF